MQLLATISETHFPYEILWLIAAPLLFFIFREGYRRLYPDVADQAEGAQSPDPLSQLLSDMTVTAMTPVIPPQSRQSGTVQYDPDNQFICVHRAARLMTAYPGSWCIAGGWALSLAAGNRLREHRDIEIAVFRPDQQKLMEHVAGWHAEYVDPATANRVAWQPGKLLELPIHEIHTRPPQADVLELEFLLNESADGMWVYRRNNRVVLELEKAIITGPEGIPCLAPEIVLLYKSKNPRPRDNSDFEMSCGLLDPQQRNWLYQAICIDSPEHPWLGHLSG